MMRDSTFHNRLPQSDPPPRFMGVRAAGAYVGVSAESIRRLIRAGTLTALRPVPGRVVIDRQELEQLVRNSDIRPPKGRGASTAGRMEFPND